MLVLRPVFSFFWVYSIGSKIVPLADNIKIVNKPNPETYTGHCWRRTSATVMANSSASAQELQYGKTTQTANEYIDSSTTFKISDAEALCGSKLKSAKTRRQARIQWRRAEKKKTIQISFPTQSLSFASLGCKQTEANNPPSRNLWFGRFEAIARFLWFSNWRKQIVMNRTKSCCWICLWIDWRCWAQED